MRSSPPCPHILDKYATNYKQVSTSSIMPSPFKPKPARRSETLVSPRCMSNNPLFQYSIHTIPSSFKRDLAPVFPDASITPQTPLLIIPTFQKSDIELLTYGEQQDKEKDRLLLSFYEWSDQVRQQILAIYPQAWVDVTDPASGIARWGNQGSLYSDVEGVVKCLKYETMDCGGCRILKHPSWKYSVYPATMFTTVPLQLLQHALCIVESRQ